MVNSRMTAVLGWIYFKVGHQMRSVATRCEHIMVCRCMTVLIIIWWLWWLLDLQTRNHLCDIFGSFLLCSAGDLEKEISASKGLSSRHRNGDELCRSAAQ